MIQEITSILKALDNKNQAVSAMEEQTMEMLNDRHNIFVFIDNVKKIIQVTTDPRGDRHPYYYLFLAVAYIKQKEYESAKNDLANAVQGFQILGFTVNEALSEWLFGIIHFENGDMTRSQQACNSSLRRLSSLVRECEDQSNYNRAKVYKNYLKQVEKYSKKIHSPQPKKDYAPSPSSSYEPLQVGFPWVPIYDSVRAGRNGLIPSDPLPKKGISVQVIELEGNLYDLFSLQSSTKTTEHKIHLVREVEYGFAKVEGQSMNASKPIPIEDGDYVLFSRGHDGRDGIVIAGQTLNDHEGSIMVKRYETHGNLLISDTTDTNEDYSPIELTDDYQILGVVLAVAKLSHKLAI